MTTISARRSDTEARILRAATAAFSESGYDGARTRQIAAAADCNEQLIQRYFGGKAGLLLAVLDEVIPLSPAITALPPASSIEAEIALCLEHALSAQTPLEQLVRVALDRALTDATVAAQLRAITTSRHAAIAARLRRHRPEVADEKLQALAEVVNALYFAWGATEQFLIRFPRSHLTEIVPTAASLLARCLADDAQPGRLDDRRSPALPGGLRPQRQAGDGAGAAAKASRSRAHTTASLLSAAIEVFSLRGYEGATTRAVSELAGVNEQLIQRYFGGKPGLLRAIVERGLRPGAHDFDDLPRGPDLRSEIQSILYFSLNRGALAEIHKTMRVLIHRAIVDPEIANLLRQVLERRQGLILERLKAHDPELSPAEIFALSAMVGALSFHWGITEQLIILVPRPTLEGFVARASYSLSPPA